MTHLDHSCEPNFGLQGQVVFLSLRDIVADEELTFDYAMTDDEPYEMKCQCGMPNCRGTITGFDWLKPEIQNKYDGYFRGLFSDASMPSRVKHRDNRGAPSRPA